MSRRIGLLLHPGEEAAVRAAMEAARECGLDPWTTVDDPVRDVATNAEGTALLVTVGGDGTFLFGARLAAPRGIPVLGANRGRLGFLNDVELNALPLAIRRFAGGDFRIQLRSLVDCTLGGADSAGATESLALNEVVVRTRDAAVARLRVLADGELLGEFDADGVVVATATGSTAYALSAGGPPVDPRLRALVVVPLAPHAVISRPVVIPDEVRVEVEVLRGRVVVAADGISLGTLDDAGAVAVRPGPDLEVVRFGDSPSFHARLRQKFRFGVPHKDLERGEPASLRALPEAEGGHDAA